MKPPNLSDLVSRYLAGEGANKLAEECGVSREIFADWFAAAGIHLRGRAEANQVRKLGLNVQSIAFAYESGESELSLSNRHGVSRTAIRRVLLEAGVHIRGRSEAELLKWSQVTDPDRRKAQVRAANEAARGRVDSEMTKALRATNRERSLKEVGFGETEVIAALQSLGVTAVPQKAIGPYNLDLSVQEPPIAVEIDHCGFFYSNRAKCLERSKYILDQGWTLLYVLMPHAKYFTPLAVARKIIALVEIARSDESLRGQYGVINSQGNALTTRRSYLDGLSRVPGF